MSTYDEQQALGNALATLANRYGGSRLPFDYCVTVIVEEAAKTRECPPTSIRSVSISLDPYYAPAAYALELVAELLTGASCSSSKTQPPSRPQDAAADSEAVSLLTETFAAVCDECRVAALTPEAADVNGCGRVADGCGAYVSPTHAVLDPDGDVRGIGLSPLAAMSDAIRRTHASACRARDASQEAVRGFRSALAALSAV